MSYIQRSATNSSITPFDIGKMSGSTAIGSHQIFDSFNVSWLSFNSSTGVISASTPFFTEACFSPNSNSYGNSRVGQSGSSFYTQGQILPESTFSGAGGSGRGDDVSFYFASSQFPYWTFIASTNTAPDTSLTHLKLMRV
tara:strand:- start:103 stop:522 length:420 start_codon:yes stop_codon:yes gene_type:complete